MHIPPVRPPFRSVRHRPLTPRRRRPCHLLSAIPDVHFDLTNIVIGPQGVFEEAQVTGTHREQWLDVPPSGAAVEFTVTIFFPWNREQRLFEGERVHYHSLGSDHPPSRS